MKRQAGYATVAPQQLAALAGISRLRRWYELYQQRHLLAQLGDAALKDLGLTRADTYAESARPFWDDPLRK
ncbi:DUF1127 domain-containing protein [Pseudomonas typographi]|uniref:DUF1127 domain-containing protein n=1 Tax=Pseudomonas typographi TaxID=2715964 RepID=A0ABR7YYI4_9PSED|nr:DUF1127 domain-containing protein [Pseudomonas typographi]MBD1598191.1 DUF1127 domain-containing protein [Pseudomonas typographi]